MQKTVDAILEFDEGTVVGKIANLAADVVTHRVLLGNDLPGIHLDLLHAKADFLFVLLDLKDHHVHFLSLGYHFTGVGDSTGPGHLRDVNQSLDTLFQFDEGTVGKNVDNLAADFGTDRETLLDVVPGTRLGLLESQRDPLAILVDLEHLDIDLLFNGQDLVGVIDTAPGHVSNMQKAVDTTQIDEGAEISDVLDDTLAHLIQFDFGHQVRLQLVAALFEQLAAADDDVHTRLVDLDDLAFQILADELGNVAHPADGDLGSRKEHRNPDVDQQATLDLAQDFTGDHIPLVMGVDHLFPTLDAVRFALGQHDATVFLIDFLDEYVHGVSDGDFSTLEVASGNFTLGFVAHIDDDPVIGNADHLALDNLFFFKIDHRIPENFIDLVDGVTLQEIVDFVLEGIALEVKLLEQFWFGHGKRPLQWVTDCRRADPTIGSLHSHRHSWFFGKRLLPATIADSAALPEMEEL